MQGICLTLCGILSIIRHDRGRERASSLLTKGKVMAKFDTELKELNALVQEAHHNNALSDIALERWEVLLDNELESEDLD